MFVLVPKVQQREVVKDTEDINGNGLCLAWGPLENLALILAFGAKTHFPK